MLQAALLCVVSVMLIGVLAVCLRAYHLRLVL